MARIALLAVSALVAAGCAGGDAGDSPDGDAGVFMTRLVRDIAANRYAEAWESLHPTHQRVAPRAQYVACEELNPVVGNIAEVVVVSVKDESVRVAGEQTKAKGKAIRIRLAMRIPQGAELDSVTETFHAVAVERHWRWILTDAGYSAYRSGRCP
jgi:hypothetical protein